MGDKVAVTGILSWTWGDGPTITKRHARRYKLTFPLLHNGPVGVMNAASPTVLVIDESGRTLAYTRGNHFWDTKKVTALFEALAGQTAATASK